MKVGELRIGNIIKVNHLEYGNMFAKVTAINDCGDLCLYLLDDRFTSEEYKCTMNEVCAIPLIHEQLLRCGFDEPCDGVYEHNEYNIEVTHDYDNKCWVTWNGGEDFWFSIENLHQLQNACQVITGNELKIEL